MRVEHEVRSFIAENFLYSDSCECLPTEQSFLEKGLIDSTGMLELVNFIETRFGVQVQDHELVPENLDSIGRIVRFVNAKKAA